MKNLIVVVLCIVFINPIIYAQTKSELSIIPQPNNIEELTGEFTINSDTKINIEPGNPNLELLADMLSYRIKTVTGYSMHITKTSKTLKNAFNLIIQSGDTLSEEGYSLSVTPDRVSLEAKEENGIFYGLQTIYQLLPTKTFESTKDFEVIIPSVKIIDKPRYSWRGMMLDVGRYFYPVPFIKKFIDYLAFHKMNTFHWHLTEDHGWRIKIDKYPELTETSAWRQATQVTPGGRIDENLHGGYYSKEQIREVVDYAKKRYITVVPEIEMPGHSLAALVAYPELSCVEGPFEIPIQWGIQENIYCAGNEKTFEFLENVLSEVVELFPSPIIHIGGDEAPKKHWEQCEKCQMRIEEEGLNDEHELQSYFIKRIEEFLLTKNKNIIGWDEILEGGLAPNAAVMSWRGIEGGITAAKQKHNVIMTPTSYMYFDYYQGDPTLEPFAIPHGRVVSLQRVYSYEPIPEELTPQEAKYIKGVQGNIWSEFIHSPDNVEYMGFPRAAALAEIAWTESENKEWENFKRKMETQYKRYQNMGINYAKSAYNVRHRVDVDTTAQTATISFETDSYNPQIYYTLDGSEPTPEKLEYLNPFPVNKPVIIKAATFNEGERMSKISTEYINRSILRDGKKQNEN